MEQGHQGNALLGILQAVQLLHPLPFQIGAQALVDVDAVLAQAAGVGPMEPGRGGGGEKVALVLQVVQQGVGTVPMDVLPVDLQKCFLSVHDSSPFYQIHYSKV